MCVYVRLYIFACMCITTCLCECIKYVYECMSIFVYAYVCVCLYKYACIYMCVILTLLFFLFCRLFPGIRYVPVSRDEYLRATHCVFRLENKFSQIRRSVLLFDGHLVWSGLLQQDTRTLFRYLLQVMSEVG